MVDYSLCKMYKIIYTGTGEAKYIGSTYKKYLCQRMSSHRSADSKYVNRKNQFYTFVRENGGWNNFKIILLEKYPCDTKE